MGQVDRDWYKIRANLNQERHKYTLAYTYIFVAKQPKSQIGFWVCSWAGTIAGTVPEDVLIFIGKSVVCYQERPSVWETILQSPELLLTDQYSPNWLMVNLEGCNGLLTLLIIPSVWVQLLQQWALRDCRSGEDTAWDARDVTGH